MSEIYPADGQPIGEVITELTALGLVEGQDFRQHWTWDMRPYIVAEPDAYKKWEKDHGGESTKDTTAKSDEDSTSSDSDSKGSSSDSGSTASSSTTRKRGGK